MTAGTGKGSGSGKDPGTGEGKGGPGPSQGVQLWRFPVSHYCDLVEFQLRAKGVPYEVVKRQPFRYKEALEHTGDDEWPFLLTPDGPRHWTDATAWVEKAGPGPSLWPADPRRADEARHLVHYATRVVGHATRRLMFRGGIEDPGAVFRRYGAGSFAKRVAVRAYLRVVAGRIGATAWAVGQDEEHLDELFAGEGLVRAPAPGVPLLDEPRRTVADIAVATMLGPVLLLPKYERRWGSSALWEWTRAEYRALRALPVPGAPTRAAP